MIKEKDIIAEDLNPTFLFLEGNKALRRKELPQPRSH